MAARSKVRFKASDIFDAPDNNLRYEVIDRELFMTPSPSWKHQTSLMRLSYLVFGWVFPRVLGSVVQAVGVVLDDETGVQPDLIYISRERAGIISARGVEGPPDLVVEVLSPSTEARDRNVKMRRYAAGIAHYWLLDPRAESLEAYVLGENGYALEGIHRSGAIFRPALFPDLEIPIATLWAD